MASQPLSLFHERTYRLPFGFIATFSIQGTHFEVSWEPDTPSTRTIRTPKARRRLINAYVAARSDFIRDLSTMHGLVVAIVDEEGIEIRQPESVQ